MFCMRKDRGRTSAAEACLLSVSWWGCLNETVQDAAGYTRVWGPDSINQCNSGMAPMLDCAPLCCCTGSDSCLSLLSPWKASL